MAEKRDEKLLHSIAEKRKSASCITRMKILMCIDYIVNHIKNFDDYDFKHAWNTMGVPVDLGHMVNTVCEEELSRCKMNGIEDEEIFEGTFRIGLQSLFHAVYPKEFESLGCYLYPRTGIFSL